MINLVIDSNDRTLALHFDQLPDVLRDKLRVKIAELTQILLAQVKAREPRRTGRLQSLTRSYVDTREDFVRGRVTILGGAARHNVAAAALEYGAHRAFTVRSHRRGSARVSAYRRRANIDAQRFLRGPAAAILPRARLELEAVVAAALAEVDKP